ncbi:hypothetical protein EXU48_16570 [Occultella glacieicola]|uniref:Uncharacterized protein n=1 Tax=Occultella glacieicola TaxID=2518684 RepID=A0ABY2E008_9MICO|nr:hypothetical protein [Occultella glacieicola]TDE90738.1 hypothetical protein EXU48_16570 [Occultella glacieicola]
MTAFPDPSDGSPSVPVLRLGVTELAHLLGISPTPAARISRIGFGLDDDVDRAPGRRSLVRRGLLGPHGPVGDAKRVMEVLTHGRSWLRVVGATGDAAHVVMGTTRAVVSSPIPDGHEFAPIVASVAVAEAVADLACAVVQRSGRPAKVQVVRLGYGRSDEVIEVPTDRLERDVVVDVARSLGLPLSDVR